MFAPTWHNSYRWVWSDHTTGLVSWLATTHQMLYLNRRSTCGIPDELTFIFRSQQPTQPFDLGIANIAISQFEIEIYYDTEFEAPHDMLPHSKYGS